MKEVGHIGYVIWVKFASYIYILNPALLHATGITVL